MFDKTTNNTTNNYINSENAMMVKTQEDSFMVHCKLGSFEAKMLFDSTPSWEYYSKYINVIVLQVMYCGDGYVICEVIADEKEEWYWQMKKGAE